MGVNGFMVISGYVTLYIRVHIMSPHWKGMNSETSTVLMI